MRALGLTEYGGPEVLRWVHLPDPSPGEDEILIRITAAGVNPADAMLRDGLLAASYGNLPFPYVPGMDVAGIVEAIGEGVDPGGELRVGAAVTAVLDNSGQYGGYSERVTVPAASAVRAPRGASFEHAASFLMNALTARTALDALSLAPGATIAVTGSAGGVGGAVIQLGRLDGLHVIADARPEDADLVRSLGASKVVARGDTFAYAVRGVAPDGVDAVVDGATMTAAALPAVRDGGQLAVFRGWAGEAGRGIRVHPVNVRDHVRDSRRIRALRDAVEDGNLTTRVANSFPADHAIEAHRMLDAGGVRGRIVLLF